MSLGIVGSVDEAFLQSGDVCCMVFHEGRLYTGAEGGKLMVYNENLSVYKEIQAQYNTVNAICIWNDHLVTTGNDGLIKLWDLKNLSLQKTLSGHENEVRKLLPTKNRLYSGDMNGKVKIWGTDGTCQFTLSVVEEVWDIAVLDDICYTVRDKDVTVTEVKFKKDGVDDETQFVIATSFEGRAPLQLVGSTLCYADRPGTVIHLRGDKSKQHAEIGKLQGHNKIITAMDTQGGHLYSGGYDKSVKVWDIGAQKLIAQGTTVSSAVMSLAAAPDGSVYAGLEKGYIVHLKKC